MKETKEDKYRKAAVASPDSSLLLVGHTPK